VSGVAIFVKTPGHSPVKTRLAADRGQAWTEAWYRRAAAAVAAVARATIATSYWAVAEPEAIATGAWPDLPAIAQGDGGLGSRMARVHAALVGRHGGGVLLGADAPQITVDLLVEALDWLASPSPRLVLGPSRDGGFWLFGANVAPPEGVWTSVPYSIATTATDFRAALAPYGAWHTLATLTDADHGPDLDLVLNELRALPAPLPEQRALATWMAGEE